MTNDQGSAGMTSVFCCDDGRKNAVLTHGSLNGIDYLEVLDHDAPAPADRQRILRLHFIKAPAPAGLTPANVRIGGGTRITIVTVASLVYDGDVVVVTVDQPGDASTYLFQLVTPSSSAAPLPLAGLDPLLAEILFSFKVDCASDLDCAPAGDCPPEAPAPPPDINYLAKDYGSFRRLLLDRMSALLPDWRGRNVADLGVMLVEVLAYVGDYLSYRQDAVATEAYLGTARRRVSLRRHATLVDYRMHDGCNARVWVQVRVSADGVTLPLGTPLLSRTADRAVTTPLLAPGGDELRRALESGGVVFETLHDIELFAAHNELSIYAWGGRRCCLAKGATGVFLRGALPDLAVGDVVVFVERKGPETGARADADPAHRHPVRLTFVDAGAEDPLGGRFQAPPHDGAVALTELRWAAEDALPFPLCVSAELATGEPVDDVSVVLGNIVLADHGQTVSGEALGAVPAPSLFHPPAESAGGSCARAAPAPILPRFRPHLAHGPVTQAALVEKTRLSDGLEIVERAAFDPEASAAAATRWEMASVVPAVSLNSTGTIAASWRPVYDLFTSDRFSPDFVVEVDDRNRSSLRFGDDTFGMRPPAGTAFTARYRVGNGRAGNVGREALRQIVASDPAIIEVWNPLPALGGIDPEQMEPVRAAAPVAFRRQERAVTEADYAEVLERRPEVQRAAALFGWTGSWYTVFSAIDRRGGLAVDQTYESEARAYLERFRVVGKDLEVHEPLFVPLEIELFVCVKPTYFRADVRRALLGIFHAGVGRDGALGLLHADRFTPGTAVYASPFVAAAQGVDGVEAVTVVMFRRQGKPASEAALEGQLLFDVMEVARVDNDPSFPENGVFRLVMGGGR